MNWAFELLGVAPGTDAASVKRAYARLLRITRPDEDPAGFQRLHAAYKLVLAQAAEHAGTPAHAVVAASPSPETPRPVPSTAAPSPAPASVPTPPRAPASVPPAVPAPVAAPVPGSTYTAAPASDPGILAQAVIRSAIEAENANALTRWLERRLEFWSIPVKLQTGQLVLNALFRQPQAMSTDCLDALLQFFDFNHVLAGVNPVALQELRARQTTLWELLPANHRELAKRMRVMWGQQPGLVSLRKDIALLQRPFSWLRTVWVGARPSRALQMGRLAHTLLGKQGRLEHLPPSIDRHHVDFWLHAATTRAMSWQRFILGSLRIGLVALLLSCLVGSITFLTTLPPDNLWQSTMTSGGATAMIVFGAWLIYSGCIWLDCWQGLPENAPTRKPWLRWFSVPLLCAFALLFDEAGASFLLMMPIAMAIVVLAARRLSRRAGVKPIPMTTTFIVVSVIASVLLTNLQESIDYHAVALTLLTALALWVADLWRHRAYLHPKLARR